MTGCTFQKQDKASCFQTEKASKVHIVWTRLVLNPFFFLITVMKISDADASTSAHPPNTRQSVKVCQQRICFLLQGCVFPPYMHTVVRGSTWHLLRRERERDGEKEGRKEENVQGELRFAFHSLLFLSQSWVKQSKSWTGSTHCLSLSLREGEETTAHSFPFKSLFLLRSQVHWEARADAGICLSLQHFVDSAEIWEEKRVRAKQRPAHESCWRRRTRRDFKMLSRNGMTMNKTKQM